MLHVISEERQSLEYHKQPISFVGILATIVVHVDGLVHPVVEKSFLPLFVTLNS